MKIRDKLSLQFALLSAIIFLLVLASIYIAEEKNRSIEFYNRLNDRALTVAELFLGEDNMSKEKFEEVQKRYPQSLPNETVHIYNDKNIPVFINQNLDQWPRGIIDEIKVKHKVAIKQDGKQSIGIYYVDNSGNYVVIVSAIDKYGSSRNRQLLWSMAFSFFIAVVVMFLLGRWFAWTALAPISKAVKQVKDIRSSSLERRLQTKESKDEINELIGTFNNLLEHLEQSFSAQRSFVANASHELRTPLTSIIGSIEVTLAFERSISEYTGALKNVLSMTERLSELINALFDLAQTTIDVDDFEDIRLDELMWQVKDEWVNKVPGSEIDLRYNLDADERKYTIRGKEYLLFIALGNIIKNAIKFSDNRAVICTVESHTNDTTISIRDTGIGIEPADLAEIFQPFKRGANAQGYEGFGIGLSLTEKILRLHDATIHVASDTRSGTEFIVYFPNLYNTFEQR
jgi:signal transduction histidine kinase